MTKNLWVICLLGLVVGCGGSKGDGSGSSSAEPSPRYCCLLVGTEAVTFAGASLDDDRGRTIWESWRRF